MTNCNCSGSISEDFTANGKKFKLVEQQTKDGFSMYVTDSSLKTISPTYSVSCADMCNCDSSEKMKMFGNLKNSLKETTINDTKKWFSKL